MTDAGDTSGTASSGNVFADLELDDADQLLARANLALHIIRAIEDRRLTQAQAARLLDIDRATLTAITSGRLDGISTERLMGWLNALGCDIQIHVSAPHPTTRGHVVFA